jgi:MFS family permease
MAVPAGVGRIREVIRNAANRVAIYNGIGLSETFSAWARTISLEAVVGLTVGGLIGMFAAIARKRALSSAWLNAALGMIGFVGGAVGMALAPWRATVVTKNIGGMIVTSTVMRYPHPYRVAFAAAIVLPMICELIRGARRKTSAVNERP